MRPLGPILVCACAALAADAPWPTNGWTTSTPEEQGMDSALLERADELIRTSSPNRYSFLVVRNGYLVFERYYGGADVTARNQVASITKSFVSALTGIAAERALVRPEDRFLEVFPEYIGVGDPRVADLRVVHMLTMSGGFAFDDNSMQAMTSTRNWVRWMVEQPMESAPGERFRYSSGLTHMLSAVLTRRTGMSARDFAIRYLMGPLGIRDWDWGYDWQLVYFGGWGMGLTPRDLAKLGYLYLHNGDWDGRQVVPAAWVRDSVAPHIRHNTGPGDFYGYLWWLDEADGFLVPYASGAGSQRIWYSPELNLVVVTTSQTSGQNWDILRLLREYVIPSVFHGAPRVNADGIVNAGSGARRVVAPDSFVTLYGENLAPAEVHWGSLVLDGKTLPRVLGGIGVKIAGRDCFVSYAGPTQANVLVPADVPAGEAEVEVRHPGGVAKAAVVVAPVSPALFEGAVFAGQPVYVDEAHPARAGDNIELYANGLGVTAAPHAAGEVLTQAYPHASPAAVRVFFGDVEVAPQAVNMTYAGLWQINVRVPEAPGGKVAVTVRVAGQTSAPILLATAR